MVSCTCISMLISSKLGLVDHSKPYTSNIFANNSKLQKFATTKFNF